MSERTSRARRIARRRRQRNRRILLTVALVVLVALASIGGTIAWLTSTSNEVVNTFSPAGINITLTETWNTDADGDGKSDSWEAHLVPGTIQRKDPVVTVDKSTDVEVYLFVEFTEPENHGSYLTYKSNLNAENGWTQGTGETGDEVPTNVWYRKVGPEGSEKSFQLLACNNASEEGHKDCKGCVNIPSTLTESDMPSVNVTMKYKAYAIQTEGFDNAVSAWKEVSSSTTP